MRGVLSVAVGRIGADQGPPTRWFRGPAFSARSADADRRLAVAGGSRAVSGRSWCSRRRLAVSRGPRTASGGAWCCWGPVAVLRGRARSPAGPSAAWDRLPCREVVHGFRRGLVLQGPVAVLRGCARSPMGPGAPGTGCRVARSVNGAGRVLQPPVGGLSASRGPRAAPLPARAVVAPWARHAAEARPRGGAASGVSGPGRARLPPCEPARSWEQVAGRARIRGSLPDLDRADHERALRHERATTRVGDEISLGRAFLTLVDRDVAAHQIRERRSVESFG